jgi:hypothetical protein
MAGGVTVRVSVRPAPHGVPLETLDCESLALLTLLRAGEVPHTVVPRHLSTDPAPILCIMGTPGAKLTTPDPVRGCSPPPSLTRSAWADMTHPVYLYSGTGDCFFLLVCHVQSIDQTC